VIEPLLFAYVAVGIGFVSCMGAIFNAHHRWTRYALFGVGFICAAIGILPFGWG